MFQNQVFVRNTLAEDYVGLEKVDDGIYDLFFCFCLTSLYELRTNKIHAIVSKAGVSMQRMDHASRI